MHHYALPVAALLRSVVQSDHGKFVLLNVYVPNAGEAPERPRLSAKLAFLAALTRRVEELFAAGRQVRGVAGKRPISVHFCSRAGEKAFPPHCASPFGA
jgi:hypothetical protein